MIFKRNPFILLLVAFATYSSLVYLLQHSSTSPPLSFLLSLSFLFSSILSSLPAFKTSTAPSTASCLIVTLGITLQLFSLSPSNLSLNVLMLSVFPPLSILFSSFKLTFRHSLIPLSFLALAFLFLQINTNNNNENDRETNTKTRESDPIFHLIIQVIGSILTSLSSSASTISSFANIRGPLAGSGSAKSISLTCGLLSLLLSLTIEPSSLLTFFRISLLSSPSTFLSTLLLLTFSTLAILTYFSISNTSNPTHTNTNEGSINDFSFLIVLSALFLFTILRLSTSFTLSILAFPLGAWSLYALYRHNVSQLHHAQPHSHSGYDLVSLYSSAHNVEASASTSVSASTASDVGVSDSHVRESSRNSGMGIGGSNGGGGNVVVIMDKDWEGERSANSVAGGRGSAGGLSEKVEGNENVEDDEDLVMGMGIGGNNEGRRKCQDDSVKWIVWTVWMAIYLGLLMVLHSEQLFGVGVREVVGDVDVGKSLNLGSIGSTIGSTIGLGSWSSSENGHWGGKQGWTEGRGRKAVQLKGNSLKEIEKEIPKEITKAIWLTVADQVYFESSTRHLKKFLNGLNDKNFKKDKRRNELVVLCLDEGCLKGCQEEDVYGYLRVYETKPRDKGDAMNRAIFAKVEGLRDLSGGWRVVFADGDVFMKLDPWVVMDDEETDLYIQTESHRRWVNIGFFSTKPSLKAQELWEEVLRRLNSNGGWDQDHVNEILGSEELRKVDGNEVEQRLEFLAKNQMKVKVFEAKKFWGGHMGWFVWEESLGLHLTCADTTYLKFLLAGAHGYWQDVGGYYSRPRKMLSIANLSGTLKEIEKTVEMLIAAAKFSKRALLLPLFAEVLAPVDKNDGNDEEDELLKGISRLDGGLQGGSGVRIHRRFLWSVVDMTYLKEQNPDLEILEPNYLAHVDPLGGDDEDEGEDGIETKMKIWKEVERAAEMDLRPIWLWELLKERLEDGVFKERLHVKILTDEGPAGMWSRYGKWEIEEEFEGNVRMCENVERVPGCKELCRTSNKDEL